MKILVTGNMGYVGPLVARQLRETHPDAILVGYDSGYFAHCLTGAAVLPERLFDEQLFGDVRELGPAVMRGVDAVVHLAAVSNDPMGDRFAGVTAEINYETSARVGRMARDAGVRAFVFASSCSVYGVADGPPRRETDPVGPVTAYAKSKIATEQALAALDAPDMTITALRFATACGMSDRLRLDLVLNDFVACALASGRITVLSDGTPWRPLIDVRDMARAIDWAIGRTPADGGRVLVVNTSADSANYQVRDLARAVAVAVPGTTVDINTAAPADSRSYKVDFSLFARLAPRHQPQVSLAGSIGMLKSGLEGMDFRDENFRTSQLIRLRVLDRHIAEGRLRGDLRWAGRTTAAAAA
jgi:nucleoside-diphosphate-sugar epimerase